MASTMGISLNEALRSLPIIDAETGALDHAKAGRVRSILRRLNPNLCDLLRRQSDANVADVTVNFGFVPSEGQDVRFQISPQELEIMVRRATTDGFAAGVTAVAASLGETQALEAWMDANTAEPLAAGSTMPRLFDIDTVGKLPIQTDIEFGT